MRTDALRWRLAVPAALVLLVALLATLQYRWLGQVSEAERERLKASLRGRAQDFADAFDAELLWVQLAFQAGPAVTAADGEAFARTFEAWRDKAKHPRMVRHIYLVAASNDQQTVQRFDPDARRFADVPWPEALAPLRSRLGTVRHLEAGPPPDPTRPASAEVVLLHDLAVASIPAMLVSLPPLEPADAGVTRRLFSVRLGDRFLAVHLDRDYIRSTVLPALAAEHFAGRDADLYRIAVLDSTPRADLAGQPVIFSRGLAAGARIDAAHADAAMPLFAVRFELAPRVAPRLGARTSAGTAHANLLLNRSFALPPAAGGRTKPGTVAIVVESRTAVGEVLKFNARAAAGAPAWQLLLQHPAGSLDSAVAQARRRNLWLSFGILAVLAAGVALIVVNAHRSERLAAQQMDFVATVSHELRTPLAVIRSAAQNLSAGVVHDPARTRHYGEMIDSEGRRLSDMVEQVLEYAGLAGTDRAAGRHPLDIGQLLGEVADSWAAMLEAQQVRLALDIADDLPPVSVDAAALRRVFDNLLGNAMKYGADGRWIGVTVRPVKGRGRAGVQIAVSDRGRGIDPADLPHVFEPFYRGRDVVERQIPGNGIGLSLVKRIVEAHGGRVAARSAPGQGVVMTIQLPAAGRDEAADLAAETV